eukprot:977030_1
MTSIIICTLVYLQVSTIHAAQWILSSSTLPSMDNGYAVGVYDNSIYLLGGYNNPKQLTEYNIADDTFINHGTQTLWSSQVSGYTQYWTQEQEILYFKAWNSDDICIFDMRTKTFISSYINNIPSDVLFYTCLASDPTHLFVLGGSKQNRLTNYAPVSNAEAYEFKSGKWREGVVSMPNMKSKRADHSCITNDKDTLYAIGGYSTATTVLSSIEVIDTTTQSWKYIESLSLGLAWTRCVLYNEMIYIVGGAYANDINAQIWYGTDKVHTINVLNDDVAVLSDTMPVHVARGATVLSEDVLYVFRGWDAAANTNLNSWMIYDFNFIPTIATTVEPTTNDPTTSKPTTSTPSTFEPTSNQPTTSIPTSSDSTTSLPTASHPTTSIPTLTEPPSLAPTHMDIRTSILTSSAPSKGNSFAPSVLPTAAPSPPTTQPTTRPTDSPITVRSPTRSPIHPTPLPTRLPTLHPTTRPSSMPTTSVHPIPSPSTVPFFSISTPGPTLRPTQYPSFQFTSSNKWIPQMNTNTSTGVTVMIESNAKQKNWVLPIIGIILMVTCLVIFGAGFTRRKRKLRKGSNTATATLPTDKTDLMCSEGHRPTIVPMTHATCTLGEQSKSNISDGFFGTYNTKGINTDNDTSDNQLMLAPREAGEAAPVGSNVELAASYQPNRRWTYGSYDADDAFREDSSSDGIYEHGPTKKGTIGSEYTLKAGLDHLNGEGKRSVSSDIYL